MHVFPSTRHNRNKKLLKLLFNKKWTPETLRSMTIIVTSSLDCPGPEAPFLLQARAPGEQVERDPPESGALGVARVAVETAAGAVPGTWAGRAGAAGERRRGRWGPREYLGKGSDCCWAPETCRSADPARDGKGRKSFASQPRLCRMIRTTCMEPKSNRSKVRPRSHSRADKSKSPRRGPGIWI